MWDELERNHIGPSDIFLWTLRSKQFTRIRQPRVDNFLKAQLSHYKYPFFRTFSTERTLIMQAINEWAVMNEDTWHHLLASTHIWTHIHMSTTHTNIKAIRKQHLLWFCVADLISAASYSVFSCWYHGSLSFVQFLHLHVHIWLYDISLNIIQVELLRKHLHSQMDKWSGLPYFIQRSMWC